MKKYIINGLNFSNYNQAYKEIKNVLTEGINEENLRLPELIEKYLISNSEQFVVIWENSEKSKIDLGYGETLAYLKRKLETVPMHELVDSLIEIKNIENQKGDTLFDTIIKSFAKYNINVCLQ